MKNRIALLLILALALPLALFADGTKEKAVNPDVIQVQLIPSRDAAYLDAQRMPMQQMLEAQLKRKVNVTVATDYNALIEGMAAGQIHVGLLATTAYVMAADEGFAEAILKSTRYDVDDNGNLLKDKPLVSGYKAQLVAGADSGIKSVKDLKGKKIAIASFTSTSGFVWPANLLADNGLDPEKDVTWMNVGGHDNAITAVFNGQADAAFTFKDARTLFSKEAFYPDLMKKVVLISNTSEIPNDTISVIPNLDPKLKEAIRMAFINMVKDPKGLEIMRKIYNHEGYAPAKDSDYDLVRTYLARQKKWTFK
ncbi:MAG TPA: phosphate/phosphite/phosphonate ABC transporter substrate-binding protein [Spirochaetia bacterium]|nr:phosphate/phosphite/phosphonate ABC transporter substrate-binding protein [Spirochaetales bacterium]HRY80310.1 phosphate/phosphite/phosphonate ABC transporter substrate-binding protein [Spirochaetia bacterium]HRZ89336.1 phosphate/phosphite/phosphonate ABC transporter substrate-binding protein [Spirochaetia bacterium]